MTGARVQHLELPPHAGPVCKVGKVTRRRNQHSILLCRILNAGKRRQSHVQRILCRMTQLRKIFSLCGCRSGTSLLTSTPPFTASRAPNRRQCLRIAFFFFPTRSPQQVLGRPSEWEARRRSPRAHTTSRFREGSRAKGVFLRDAVISSGPAEEAIITAFQCQCNGKGGCGDVECS